MERQIVTPTVHAVDAALWSVYLGTEQARETVAVLPYLALAFTRIDLTCSQPAGSACSKAM